MKKSILLLLGLTTLTLHAQLATAQEATAQVVTEREVKTDVSEVTVYLENALETRKATVDVLPGKTMLKFTGMSPFIDAKSIQAKIDGDVTVLSVNLQQNFQNNTVEPKLVTDLRARIKAIDQKIGAESVLMSVIEEDIAFLKQNRGLGGTQSVSVATVKEGADFFSARFTALKSKELERSVAMDGLQKERNALVAELEKQGGDKVWATSELMVLVDAKKAGTLKAVVSYIISNASWYPTYDIRANNITDPIQIVYKANIRQDSKCDWKNVKLKLSSYNQTISAIAPELQTYDMGFNTKPPVYQQPLSSVGGRISNFRGEPLAGVRVNVVGSSLSTMSDKQGIYSITLPTNLRELEFSLFGYYGFTRKVFDKTMNVFMNENQQAFKDLVRTTPKYTVDGPITVSGSSEVYTVQGTNEEKGVDIADLEDHKLIVEEKSATAQSNAKIRGTAAIPEQERIEKAISVDFEVKTPYTILSDNNVVSVDMESLSLPAVYQYVTIPKLGKDVFLKASIQDWEQYNFLVGEANVFFEDTYVGKTILDNATASDTLSISLGRDKKIVVQREKIKDYSSKQFIGTKNIETRDWKTTIRNNRNEKINLMVLDQVPVSIDADIEISQETTPEAQLTAATGEVKWETIVNPGQNKVFNLKYTVKFPKLAKLIVE
jgi:hypothetical protein